MDLSVGFLIGTVSTLANSTNGFLLIDLESRSTSSASALYLPLSSHGAETTRSQRPSPFARLKRANNAKSPFWEANVPHAFAKGLIEIQETPRSSFRYLPFVPPPGVSTSRLFDSAFQGS